jgi:molybdate transport system substrate-binding protein
MRTAIDGQWGSRGWRAGLLAATWAAVAGLTVAACGSSSSPSPSTAPAGGKVSGKLVVFAAASLSGAFDKIAAQFKAANPGVTVTFNYAGSSSLSQSIKQGAPADVFASADTKNMKTVTDATLASGTPKVFARNQGEIMVETGNPKNITAVKDLGNSALKVVVCAPEVPCGSLAQEIFQKTGVTVKPVSEETSVSGVVTKVTLGEADAGMVYVTDVRANAGKAEGVAIPSDQNATTDYPIVQLKDAPNAAAGAAFISYVLGPEGQKVLADFGFLSPG